jgi:hypothetical protein
MQAKEVKAFVIKSLFTDDNQRQIAVMERYINWLKNEPLHTEEFKTEPEVEKISGDQQVELAEKIMGEPAQSDVQLEEFKPF